MTSIDPTARVYPGAAIGAGATIGPFCVIGPDAVIGDGCRLVAHVHVTGRTTIGARTVVYPFTSLGTPPQSTKYRGGPTRLEIGADCDIRENVTINIGTEDDRGITEVGDHCALMAGSHVAHDCKVGAHVTFANNALIGGHVSVGDYAFLGGHAAVRQFVRIGEGAMIAGMSGIRADVIPWGLAQGPLATHVGINVIGLTRRGFTRVEIRRLHQVFRLLFHGAGQFRDRLAAIEKTCGDNSLVASVVTFIREGKRPLSTALRRENGAGLEHLGAGDKRLP